MNCDPIARWYRWLELIGFGGELQRRRVAFLPQVADARRVLVLGDGDGRFLVKLVEQNRGASIDYVDLSARMLDLAKARAGDRVTYHQADALTIQFPENTYDLITSHFFLDCFEEGDAEALVIRIARAVRPDVRWLISEFRQPSQGLRAAWARVWLKTLYFFFHLTTGLKANRLVDHRPILERHGFRLVKEETTWFGLLASELWKRIPANP